VKFLVDNQLPPALARFIAQDLHAEALHVTDVNLRDASDLEIWEYASKRDLILVSKDEDFVTLYSRAPTASLLWVRLRNCRRTVLLEAFAGSWSKIQQSFAIDHQFVEFR